MEDKISEPRLTPRERQIVDLAGKRLGDKEIAKQLGLSPRTVQNHLHRAYEKLGVSDRIQAAQWLIASYSGQSEALSHNRDTTPDSEISAAAGTRHEHGGVGPGLAKVRAFLAHWRQPRKLGGTLVWLIFGWALVWLIVAAVGATLSYVVLELVQRLR